MNYQEDELVARLATLDRSAKTAFAALCAEWLFPVYAKYADVHRVTEAARLRSLLEGAWAASAGVPIDGIRMSDQAESLVPGEDEESSGVLQTVVAQNAAAAVAYALRAWTTDDPQEAAWAARQVYEAADANFWSTSPELEFTPATEMQALSSLVVRDSLEVIERSLVAAESGPSAWTGLRPVISSEARAWVTRWFSGL